MPLAPGAASAGGLAACPQDRGLLRGARVGIGVDLAGRHSWSEDTLVQPDVFVVPDAEGDTLDWRAMRTLWLVAEVLSPSTAKHDRFQKRKLYQARRVGTLWLVDAERHTVEVWTPDATFPTIEIERVTWRAQGAATPLVIELAELFAPV